MSEFMQHEITSKQKLLNANGNITEPGFAKKLYWEYIRNDIKAPNSELRSGTITISEIRTSGFASRFPTADT